MHELKFSIPLRVFDSSFCPLLNKFYSEENHTTKALKAQKRQKEKMRAHAARQNLIIFIWQGDVLYSF